MKTLINKNEKLKKCLSKIESLITRFYYFLTPLITCIIFLLIFKANSLYPFGNKSIAWCDMNQQVIPLLNCFKDVLEGKQGFTYNLANAGGMSLFSVYFFFLSSPLSYLVIFVSKTNMANFMNLLVMFKIMIISFTICFYFHKKYKNLNPLINISLSLLYAFSIYTLMYYQNIMCLNIVYIFPLLILSLDYILNENKPIPYLILIVTSVLLNYYLAFMVICFVVLYMGLNFFYRRKEENIKEKAKSFIITSVIGALISCFSIVPSFIQYLDSARTSSIFDTISFAWFLTNIQTSIPLILGSVSVVPFLFKKTLTIEKKVKYILLILLLIPIIVDPINCMWHMGSYQAFPCRFAFMFSFLILDICACNINEAEEEKFTLKHLFGLVSSIVLIILLFIFESTYIKKKIQDLDQYSTSLWGNSTSFEALLRYYSIVLIIIFGIYILFKLKFINKKILSLSFINFTIVEILFSTSVYMIPPSRDHSYQSDIFSLKENIDDSSFYRVKTDSKITEVNNIGGAGFNSLSHYTSLTNEDYMFTMKKLGYSSYWMEVGSNGGTSFTDALLVNKYTIKNGSNSDSKYQSDHYYLKENPVLPFGIITNNDLSQHSQLKEDTRVNMQESIYDALFNDSRDLHTIYPISSTSNVTIETKDDKTYYYTSGNATITYTIYIEGNQNLYFEAFDSYSNSLVESINDKIFISCNGKYINYPTQENNGSVYLGNFTNKNVIVRLTIKESIQTTSFNVFSINQNLLNEKINSTKDLNLKVEKNKISGNFVANKDSYLFLPISYTKGLKAQINNKNVEVIKVFSSFVAIKLVEGTNELKISYFQPGFSLGLLITLMGIGLLIGYILLNKQNKIPKFISNISYIISYVISVCVFVILYIFPLIMNILHQLK